MIDRERLGKKGVGSPVENADLLYEYFPLSLDDWYVYPIHGRVIGSRELTMGVGCRLSMRYIGRMWFIIRLCRQI